MSLRIIRICELQRRVPFSRSTFWRLERAGKFPPRMKLGKNSVGWLEADIDKWVNEHHGQTLAAQASRVKK